MADITNYKGFQVLDEEPTGNAGQALQSNFKATADHIEATNATLADLDTDLATLGSQVGGLSITVASKASQTAVDALATIVAGKADTSTLASYVTSTALTTTLSSYLTIAAATSTLSSYATTAALTAGLATKANSTHTHTQSDVTGLTAALAAKADASSLASYLKLDGTTPMTGNLSFFDGTSTWGTIQRGSGGSVYFDAPNGMTLNANVGINQALYVSGNISTGGTISGNGSGLNTLNGSNISSGTVAAARIADLSATYMPKTGGTFTGGITLGGSLTLNSQNIVGSSHVYGPAAISGNGQNAVRLQGHPNGGGTIVSFNGGYTSSTSPSAVLNVTQTVNLSGTAAGTLVYGNWTNTGSTSSATSNLLSLQLNSADRFVVTTAGNATLAGSLTASSFSGSGASLTSLNASNISSGTINAARLPSLSSTYLSLAGGTVSGPATFNNQLSVNSDLLVAVSGGFIGNYDANGMTGFYTRSAEDSEYVGWYLCDDEVFYVDQDGANLNKPLQTNSEVTINIAAYNLIPIMSGASSTTATITDSSHSPANEGWYLFDRNTGTNWVSNTGTMPQWVQVAFSAPQTVRSYAITNWPYGGNSITAWKLQGSNNGSTWTDLDTRTRGTWGAYERAVYTITTPAVYSYYRLYVTNNANGTSADCGVSGLELFGGGAINVYEAIASLQAQVAALS